MILTLLKIFSNFSSNTYIVYILKVIGLHIFYLLLNYKSLEVENCVFLIFHLFIQQIPERINEQRNEFLFTSQCLIYNISFPQQIFPKLLKGYFR